MFCFRKRKQVDLLGVRDSRNGVFTCLLVCIPKQKPCHAFRAPGTYSLLHSAGAYGWRARELPAPLPQRNGTLVAAANPPALLRRRGRPKATPSASEVITTQTLLFKRTRAS